MIKTPSSTVIGGAGIWTPGCTVIGSMQKTLDQLIKSMFANNEQGFAYDPNDLTTMFQDAAGTIPVTAAGQPVGLMKDKSGRNNHASQTVSASRPILQRNATTGAYYLAFDGADDFLQTNNIDFTTTDKVSLFTGAQRLSTSATGVVVELSGAPATTVGTFWLNTNALTPSDIWIAAGQGATARTGFSKTLLSLNNFIFSAKLDFSESVAESEIKPRLNGSASEFTRGLGESAGNGNFGKHPLYIGRRRGTSLPFTGHIYGLIGIRRLTSASETIALEKAIAKNTGVTLNV